MIRPGKVTVEVRHTSCGRWTLNHARDRDGRVKPVRIVNGSRYVTWDNGDTQLYRHGRLQEDKS